MELGPRDTALRCHAFRRFAVRAHAYQPHPAGEELTAASSPARWRRFCRGGASKPNLDASGGKKGADRGFIGKEARLAIVAVLNQVQWHLGEDDKAK